MTTRQLFIEGGKIKDKIYQQHESFLKINKMINKPDYINTLYSKMCKMAHPTTLSHFRKYVRQSSYLSNDHKR